MSRKPLTPINDDCGEHPIFGNTTPAADAFAMSILMAVMLGFLGLLSLSICQIIHDSIWGRGGFSMFMYVYVPALATFALMTVVLIKLRHIAFVPVYLAVGVFAFASIWTSPSNPYSSREDNCVFYGVCEGWKP